MRVILLHGYLHMEEMYLTMIKDNTFTIVLNLVAAMEFIQGMSSLGCAQVTRGKYSDQQYLGLGSVMFALGSTSGITYFQKAIEEGYNGHWQISKVPHTTSTSSSKSYMVEV